MTQEMDEPADSDIEYVDPSKIHPAALAASLRRLRLLGGDIYLGMQATNIGIVDGFIMQMESQILTSMYDDDRPDMSVGFFLSAQTQMWLFATYELLRTWRQRAINAVKLAKENKIQERIAELDDDGSFEHHGRKSLADQLRKILDDPDSITEIEEHLKRIFIPFAQLDFLRITLAKHENKGDRGSVAVAPGYGRFNMWCGSVEYALDRGDAIIGQINRRQIADSLRSLWDGGVPTDEQNESFRQYLKGPPRR